MGTKVHGKSYYPGYYPMRDLNEGANSGSWSMYPEDTPLKNGLYYNNCLPRPTTDGYLEYDKEVLKQTILKHDAIFRNQVSELHRLYRIQMELMDEFKRKRLGKYPMPVEASESNPLSSQMKSEDAKKMWHIPSLPSVNSACSRASVSGTDNMHSFSEFIKVNGGQPNPIPIQNGSSSKDCELLESKARKLPRRMFDLQLPADEYIDCEEGETLEKEKVSEPSVVESYPLKISCGISSESYVKLSLGSGAKPSSRGDISNSDFCIRKKHDLADLNEPFQVEETADSVPVNFVGPVSYHREIKGHNLPAKPNSSFLGLPKEFFKNTQKGESSGAHANILQSGKEGSRQERQSCNLDVEHSRRYLNSSPQGFYPQNLRISSEPIQVERKKGHAPPEYVGDNHIKREAWSQNAICGIDILKRSQNNSGHFVAPGRHYPVMPLSDVTDCVSPSVSSWRTPMSSFNQKAIAVQALPCFDTSSQLKSKTRFQSPGLVAEKRHLNCNSKSNSSFETEASHRNGFSHWSQSESSASQVYIPSVGYSSLNHNDENTSADRFGNECSTRYFKSSECRDVKSVKSINLNLSLPSLSQEGVVCQRDVVIIDGEEENEDPSRGLHWLRAACNSGPAKEKGNLNKMGFSFLQNNSHQYVEKTKDVPTPSSVQDFPSVSCSCDAEPERVEVGEGPSIKKILGFPIFDKPLSNDSSSHSSHKSSLCYPSEPEGIQNSGEVQVLNIDLSQDPAIVDSGQQSTKTQVAEKGPDKDISVVRNLINLNLCVDEEEVPSTCSSPRAGVKIAGQIDMEAPLVPEAAQCIPSGLESMDPQLVTPIQSHDMSEELVRIAAEAIVIISSSRVYELSKDATCKKSVASLWDSLQWFAGVVSSNTNDIDSKVEVVSRGKEDGDHEEASSDEIDYFEYMTLKLTETKVDEYCCSKPWASDDQTEEEKSTSLLVTRRRRGQARRGRQRRDFQRDILPGLASLSRHEVTEDLQTIGGLMRATGCAWQTGLARRNAAKNGWARGRRRSQGFVSSVTTIEISPPRRQLNNNEVGLEDSNLKGWGKTTRRPRRQRYATGNPPIPLTQV